MKQPNTPVESQAHESNQTETGRDQNISSRNSLVRYAAVAALAGGTVLSAAKDAEAKVTPLGNGYSLVCDGSPTQNGESITCDLNYSPARQSYIALAKSYPRGTNCDVIKKNIVIKSLSENLKKQPPEIFCKAVTDDDINTGVVNAGILVSLPRTVEAQSASVTVQMGKEGDKPVYKTLLINQPSHVATADELKHHYKDPEAHPEAIDKHDKSPTAHQDIRDMIKKQDDSPRVTLGLSGQSYNDGKYEFRAGQGAGLRFNVSYPVGSGFSIGPSALAFYRNDAMDVHYLPHAVKPNVERHTMAAMPAFEAQWNSRWFSAYADAGLGLAYAYSPARPLIQSPSNGILYEVGASKTVTPVVLGQLGAQFNITENFGLGLVGGGYAFTSEAKLPGDPNRGQRGGLYAGVGISVSTGSSDKKESKK